MADLNQAQQFLKLLDPGTKTFTFQTFGEGKVKGANDLTRMLHGTLEELAEELTLLNNSGAGIFVTVNQTDGKGRKKENIVRVRAIWQEDDDGYKGTFPLAPSIVVESSPTKFHRYWLLRGWLPSHKAGVFHQLMDRMVASYGSDGAAKDLARVLRIPGFQNNKETPVLVSLRPSTGTRYSLDEVASGFRPLTRQEIRRRSPHTFAQPSANSTSKWRLQRPRLTSALKHISPDDRDRWFRYGAAIYDASTGSEDGLAIWDNWSRTTKASNYSAKDQHRYWQNEFSKQRQDRTTLASIYSEAKENGWIEATTSPADGSLRLPEHPISALQHRFSIVDPKAGEETPIDIADRTISNLRKKFSQRNHHPSEAHWKGLRQIAKSIETMAVRFHEHPNIKNVDPNVDDSLYVSFLPTGMGKTSTLVEAIRTLVAIKQLDPVGVIVFLARCEEIYSLANEMGLAKDDYAVVVGRGKDKFNALGRQGDKTQARVLFTTQQMLEARSTGGRRYGDINAFHFRGRARQVRVWDEAILPSQILTVGQYDISNLFKPFSRQHPELTDELKAAFARLEAAQGGDLLEIPDFAKYAVALEEAISWVRGNDDLVAVAEALWGLSGRTVRVRKEKYANAALDYTDILPNDLAPMLILDASGQQRQTYEFWFRNRGKLRFLESPQKSYAGLTIHHWNRGAGKDAHKKHANEIARGVSSAINEEIPRDEQVLVVHFKSSGSMPDMQKKISGQVLGNKSRVKYLNWGRHTATNEFSEIKHVILAGVLQYSGPQIEAMGRSAKQMNKDEAFSEEDFQQTRYGEIAHHILQAATRGAVRKSINGACHQGCHLYVIFSAKTGGGIPRALLPRIFPDSELLDWKPTFDLKGNAQRLADTVVSLCQAGDTSVSKARLCEEIGIASHPYLNRLLKRADFGMALRAKGMRITQQRGKVLIETAGAPKAELFDSAPIAPWEATLEAK